MRPRRAPPLSAYALRARGARSRQIAVSLTAHARRVQPAAARRASRPCGGPGAQAGARDGAIQGHGARAALRGVRQPRAAAGCGATRRTCLTSPAAPAPLQDERFSLSNKLYGQYFQLYFQRLMLVAEPLKAAAQQRWPGIPRACPAPPPRAASRAPAPRRAASRSTPPPARRIGRLMRPAPLPRRSRRANPDAVACHPRCSAQGAGAGGWAGLHPGGHAVQGDAAEAEHSGRVREGP